MERYRDAPGVSSHANGDFRYRFVAAGNVCADEISDAHNPAGDSCIARPRTLLYSACAGENVYVGAGIVGRHWKRKGPGDERPQIHGRSIVGGDC